MTGPGHDVTPPPAPKGSPRRGGGAPKGGWPVMALAAGVLSAFAFLSILNPTPAAFLLFYAAPLPLFMVGLAFGWRAAAVAAAAGFAFLLVMIGLRGALFHLLAVALAPVALVRLAAIWRPAAGGEEGEAADGEGREWYPEGRLLLWLAFIGGGLVSLMLLLLGPDAESIRGQLAAMADAMLQATGLARELPADQLARTRDYLVNATPPVSTAFWMLDMMVGFWAATRLLRAFGYRMRPWAPFWRLTVHPRAMVALAAASIAALMPGVVGLIGEVFTTALLVVVFVLGLAVIHAMTLGNPWRKVLLAVLYVGLLLINGMLILPIVIIGLADLAFGLRRRFMPRPPPGGRT